MNVGGTKMVRTKVSKGKKVGKSITGTKGTSSSSNEPVLSQRHDENEDLNDADEAGEDYEEIFAANANKKNNKKKTESQPSRQIDTTDLFRDEAQSASNDQATSNQPPPLPAVPAVPAVAAPKKKSPAKSSKLTVTKVKPSKANTTKQPSKSRPLEGTGPGRGARLTLVNAKQLVVDYEARMATAGQQQGSTTRQSVDAADTVARQVKNAWDMK